jgi:hypothetical protein
VTQKCASCLSKSVADLYHTVADFDLFFWRLLFLEKSVADFATSVADFAQEEKNKTAGGPVLFQFLRDAFHYKYKLCIR